MTEFPYVIHLVKFTTFKYVSYVISTVEYNKDYILDEQFYQYESLTYKLMTAKYIRFKNEEDATMFKLKFQIYD